MCQYRTLVPGEQLVDFNDECDRLFIVVDGQIAVELEHPDMDIDPKYLQAGDYIGVSACTHTHERSARARARAHTHTHTHKHTHTCTHACNTNIHTYHPSIHLSYQPTLDDIGDYGILGERDWGASTTFNLTVNRTGEPIDIRVSAHHASHTVLLELLQEAFQEALGHAAFDVQQCVGMFCSMWQAEKLDAAALDGYTYPRKHVYVGTCLYTSMYLYV